MSAESEELAERIRGLIGHWFHMREESFRVAARGCITALKQMRNGGEMHVVAGVKGGIDTLNPAGLHVIKIHFAGDFVRLRCVADGNVRSTPCGVHANWTIGQ